MSGQRKVPSISVSLPTWQRLKAYCDLHGVSMSKVVDQVTNSYLDTQPEDLLSEDRPVAQEGTP